MKSGYEPRDLLKALTFICLDKQERKRKKGKKRKKKKKGKPKLHVLTSLAEMDTLCSSNKQTQKNNKCIDKHSALGWALVFVLFFCC